MRDKFGNVVTPGRDKSTDVKLQELVGKKLIWTGYDEEKELYYLFFEGFGGVAVELSAVLTDGAEVASKILGDRLEDATHVMTLQKLVKEHTGGRSDAGKAAAKSDSKA